MADIERIRGSDGNGEAVRAIVTAARSGGTPVGAITLQVNNTTNFPDKFIGTWGTLNLTTNLLDPATMRVFYGAMNGSNIDVLGMAPGYSDDGNVVGQVVLVKPTTAWADEIAEVLLRAHKADGSIKQVNSADPGLVFSAAATQPAADPDGRITVWFEPL